MTNASSGEGHDNDLAPSSNDIESIKGPETKPDDAKAPHLATMEDEKSDISENKRFVYSVIESRGGKAGDYFWNGLNLKVGDLCVVETGDGLEFGHISISRRPSHPCQIKKGNLGKILRGATPKDQDRSAELLRQEKEAVFYCRKKIDEYGLDMSVTRAYFTFDGLKALFFFTAEGRVDFRELVRDLASNTGLKVEMRQIGVRDEARLLGGCGPCGVELCCSSFMNDFAPVSIRMAKEQSLSLNPQKISGVCGRLMCCLSFEHENYRELSKKAPKMGKMVTAPSGQLGKVCQLNLLKEKAILAFEDKTKVEFSLSEIRPRSEEGKPIARIDENSLKMTGEGEGLSGEKASDDIAAVDSQSEHPASSIPKPQKKKGRRRKKKRGGKKRAFSGDATGSSGPAQKESGATDPARRGRQGQGKSRTGLQRKKQPPKGNITDG